ncbi:hypothetical protein LTR85_011482 [Meristemomyces frigidus]|nr:hypothetical protein LTR85_011482 [Meristemomyces frigidus]
MNPSASKKRDRPTGLVEQDDSIEDSTSPTGASNAAGGPTTNFRNVSACNRCRNRKNRCDQKLPRCTNCLKANVKCVGFDPVSKREIPRSYVYYLETRVSNLEGLLRANGISCPPPSDDFSISDAIKPGENVPFPPQDEPTRPSKTTASPTDDSHMLDPALLDRHDQHEQLNKLASNIGMVSVQGPTDTRHLGPTSGIPFARVVFAAVKSSVSQTPSERAATKPSKQLPSATASGGGGSDSFFGLNTKPSVTPAPFPDRQVGLRMAELYFEHANPQIPILHRPDFMSMFERVYDTDAKKRKPRELYLLNIVFAIGSGIIMGTTDADQAVAGAETGSDSSDGPPNRKRQRVASRQGQPEEYHSSAIVHLDSFLGSAPALDHAGGGLEELQAVLLLAGLALLRPVAPGLWYIIGVAVRLAVDLGLHLEDIDVDLDRKASYVDVDDNVPKSRGRKQWARDLRRRLWWCVYSFDRLVSTCVGRPFGITDQVVTTEFPSLLDDKYITNAGFLKPPNNVEAPSYKFVAHHYFRLRLLQSEILQVLQHRQAEQARAMGANRNNVYIYTDLPSPFLHKFHSFRDWRADIDRRLWDWKESAPKQAETGVAFTPLFLELNYWQAIITLYRQSLAVPAPLAGELSPSTGDEVQSPGTASLEAKEDEEIVFMKVAQAGQTVLKIYRQLHRLKLVNYTFLATHHLFMSGISFLYAIWHSTLVRSQLTLDDVDFTVLIATSVLSDLTDKCPPAEACRDAFMRMSKATISMCMSTTGFGNASTLGSQPLNSPSAYFSSRDGMQQRADNEDASMQSAFQPRRQMPQFDMNLRDLFSDEELAGRPAHQPKLQGFGQRTTASSSAPYAPLPVHPALKQEPSSHTAHSPHSSVGTTQYQQQPPGPPYQVSAQQPYQSFAETIPQAQPDYFEDLDFLDTFPAADPNNIWGNSNDLDLGFTGGTAFDANGAWEANGGVDLFDGFFFGNGAGGY